MTLHINRTVLKTVLVMVAIMLLALLPVVLGRHQDQPRVEDVLERLQQPLPQPGDPQSRAPLSPSDLGEGLALARLSLDR
jgi:hypothetical protein